MKKEYKKIIAFSLILLLVSEIMAITAYIASFHYDRKYTISYMGSQYPSGFYGIHDHVYLGSTGFSILQYTPNNDYILLYQSYDDTVKWNATILPTGNFTLNNTMPVVETMSGSRIIIGYVGPSLPGPSSMTLRAFGIDGTDYGFITNGTDSLHSQNSAFHLTDMFQQSVVVNDSLIIPGIETSDVGPSLNLTCSIIKMTTGKETVWSEPLQKSITPIGHFYTEQPATFHLYGYYYAVTTSYIPQKYYFRYDFNLKTHQISTVDITSTLVNKTATVFTTHDTSIVSTWSPKPSSPLQLDLQNLGVTNASMNQMSAFNGQGPSENYSYTAFDSISPSRFVGIGKYYPNVPHATLQTFATLMYFNPSPWSGTGKLTSHFQTVPLQASSWNSSWVLGVQYVNPTTVAVAINYFSTISYPYHYGVSVAIIYQAPDIIENTLHTNLPLSTLISNITIVTIIGIIDYRLLKRWLSTTSNQLYPETVNE